MNQRERLDYWKAVAIDTLREAARHEDADTLASYEWKDEYDMHNYFACFPPDGAGLESVFAGIVGGEEIRLRLLKVFEAAKNRVAGWGYFIATPSEPANDDRLRELASEKLDKEKQIAMDLNEDDLVRYFEPMPQIQIKREHRPNNLDEYHNSPAVSIDSAVSDWYNALPFLHSDALLLKEALYMMTCRYDIADFVLWPLSRHGTPIEEPFLPSFELWRHGADAYYHKPELVTVYAPGPE